MRLALALSCLALGCSSPLARSDSGPVPDAWEPLAPEHIPAGFTRTPDLLPLGEHTFAAAEMVLEANTDYAMVLQTNIGRVILDLHEVQTPITANSFVFLARHGFFDGIVFHRVLDGFMAQAGDPHTRSANRAMWGTGGSGYEFDIEIADGYAFDRTGIVGTANRGGATNSSQFFITFAPAPHLSNAAYTIFAHVTEGLEVLPLITRGEPPETPSLIRHAYIVQRPR